jgi:hypothetical protein
MCISKSAEVGKEGIKSQMKWIFILNLYCDQRRWKILIIEWYGAIHWLQLTILFLLSNTIELNIAPKIKVLVQVL